MKKYGLLLILAFLFSSFACLAKDDWKFTTGFSYASEKVYRGALYWPKASVFPLIGVSYKNLSINGPGFTLTLPTHKFVFTLGLIYFDDSPPLIPLKKHRKDFRNERKEVYDSFVGASWEFLPRFRLSTGLSKALKTHCGLYGTLGLQIPLIPFLSTGYTLGFGERRANRYAYGHEAVGGLAHKDFNLSLVLPFLPGKGTLITKYTTSRIAKDVNRNAHYVRSSDKPEVVSLLATWNL